MPEVLLYPVSLEDKIQIEKDTNTGYTENPSWILESQNSILKHSACLPLYELMQNARLEDQGKVFFSRGSLLSKREKGQSSYISFTRVSYERDCFYWFKPILSRISNKG